MTFIGRYYHALEQKGRLSIPASFRAKLGQSAIVTSGLDGCLFLFDQATWQETIETTAQGPLTKKNARDWGRYLANNAEEVVFDSQGRILLSEHARNTAHLTKDIVVVGSLNRIEIWDRETYHTYLDALEQQVETIAETVETSHE
jgi:MraZ protein